MTFRICLPIALEDRTTELHGIYTGIDQHVFSGHIQTVYFHSPVYQFIKTYSRIISHIYVVTYGIFPDRSRSIAQAAKRPYYHGKRSFQLMRYIGKKRQTLLDLLQRGLTLYRLKAAAMSSALVELKHTYNKCQNKNICSYRRPCHKPWRRHIDIDMPETIGNTVYLHLKAMFTRG